MAERAVECIILIGLPGAGKTSFYRRQFAETHLHVSKDLWPGSSNREERQQKLVTQSLESGRSIVVDNTNPSLADRAQIIRVARNFGARVIGYYFDVTTRVAIARNAERQGRARVPDVAIFTTAKRLARPVFAEGFDALYRVTIAEDRSFYVTAEAVTPRSRRTPSAMS
jgi:predicted kinase